MHKSYCSGSIRLLIIIILSIMLAPISHPASTERLLGRSFVARTESRGPKSVLGQTPDLRGTTQDLRADGPPRAPIRDARKSFPRQTARSQITPRTRQLTKDLWASSQALSSPCLPRPWRKSRFQANRTTPRGRPDLGPPRSAERAAQGAMVPAAAARRIFGAEPSINMEQNIWCWFIAKLKKRNKNRKSPTRARKDSLLITQAC